MNQEYVTQKNLPFRNEGVIKTLPNKENFRELITTRTALQKIQKGVLQTEMKVHYFNIKT